MKAKPFCWKINLKHSIANAIGGALFGCVLAATFGIPVKVAALAVGAYCFFGGSVNDLVSFLRNNKGEK